MSKIETICIMKFAGKRANALAGRRLQSKIYRRSDEHNRKGATTAPFLFFKKQFVSCHL